MKIEPAVLAETKKVAAGTAVMTALMIAVFLILRKFDYTVILGALLGALAAWVGKDTALNRHRYSFEAPGRILSLDFAPSVLTVPDEEGNEHTYDLPASNITIRKGGKYSDTASYYLFNGEIMTGTVVTFSAVSKNTLMIPVRSLSPLQ